jgi:hypothetical protein
LGERISSSGSRSFCASDGRSDHECFFRSDMMIFINLQDTFARSTGRREMVGVRVGEKS